MEFQLGITDLFKLVSGNIGLLFFAVMLFAVLVEILVLRARHKSYNWKSAGVSALISIGFVLMHHATEGPVLRAVAAGLYSVRLNTAPISWSDWPSLITLFLLVDLAFYVGHRCSHRVRILWATHSVHHSTEVMVIPATYRLAWTPILSGVVLAYLLIVLLGYDPAWVFGMAAACLKFQILLHTELGDHIRWLEWIINTPSAHRVHHGANAEYMHKNFGCVLLIWDHLFGTYQAERPDVQIRYGLSHPRSSDTNPLIIVFEGLWQVLVDLVRARDWRQRVASVLGRP